ncbi:hypothetical protein WN55_04605 [Dufourea novaeangliae]|uniref:Uncharacterized protein n=1 Tax=Dufourea novaeangliae TaxID=178035 RepID=A0A154P164_DUFNO|nr:hypothetical protein WN55_04605 [Dufourea novaeangliae]
MSCLSRAVLFPEQDLAVRQKRRRVARDDNRGPDHIATRRFFLDDVSGNISRSCIYIHTHLYNMPCMPRPYTLIPYRTCTDNDHVVIYPQEARSLLLARLIIDFNQSPGSSQETLLIRFFQSKIAEAIETWKRIFCSWALLEHVDARFLGFKMILCVAEKIFRRHRDNS